MTLHLRRFAPECALRCFDVFRDAVHNGSAPHYDEAQRYAWLPEGPPGDGWLTRLGAARTWVGEDARDLQGFIALQPGGYLDMIFVRPAMRRSGLAVDLHDAMLKDARTLGLGRLTTHASLLARPFFERQGWDVIAPETVTRDGVALHRFEMTMELP